MDVREKLIKLIKNGVPCPDGRDPLGEYCDTCHYSESADCSNERLADYLISHGVTVQEWISVDERLPQNFVSVLGYMTDAGEFPPVRECYTVGNAFFFPALDDVHPVSHWCEMPQPPKGE